MIATLATHTIGVIGSGTEEHDDIASEIGALLAAMEVNLLTGGGAGVMRSVSRAFIRNRRGRGISIGIIPCRSESERSTPKDGYPNEFVELAIATHLPHSGERGKEDLSRNHIIVLSSDALIALPGSFGTASEASLALDYGKPIISVTRETKIDEVEQFLRRVVEPEIASPKR